MEAISTLANYIIWLFGGFQALEVAYIIYMAYQWNKKNETEKLIARQNRTIILQQAQILRELKRKV